MSDRTCKYCNKEFKYPCKLREHLKRNNQCTQKKLIDCPQKVTDCLQEVTECPQKVTDCLQEVTEYLQEVTDYPQEVTNTVITFDKQKID